MIWYKFHYGDYLTHTAHLADAEDLAYRRLLDYYYMSEKPLPLDTKTVARHIRIDLDITEVVLSEFFEQTPEGWKNTRCDNEIERYNNQCVKNQNVGKRGGRPKLETDSVNDSVSVGLNPLFVRLLGLPPLFPISLLVAT